MTTTGVEQKRQVVFPLLEYVLQQYLVYVPLVFSLLALILKDSANGFWYAGIWLLLFIAGLVPDILPNRKNPQGTAYRGMNSRRSGRIPQLFIQVAWLLSLLVLFPGVVSFQSMWLPVCMALLAILLSRFCELRFIPHLHAAFWFLLAYVLLDRLSVEWVLVDPFQSDILPLRAFFYSLIVQVILIGWLVPAARPAVLIWIGLMIGAFYADTGLESAELLAAGVLLMFPGRAVRDASYYCIYLTLTGLVLMVAAFIEPGDFFITVFYQGDWLLPALLLIEGITAIVQYLLREFQQKI
ncbi:MAG: hypothetical protein KDK30_13695 [Leptospiraceae bacterium]|nr:hypothetical protein [Leptospiraceae bacterium]